MLENHNKVGMLDRLSHRRADETWLETQCLASNTRVLLYDGSAFLFDPNWESIEEFGFSLSQLSDFDLTQAVLLGDLNGLVFFVIHTDLATLNCTAFQSHGEVPKWMSLREIIPLLCGAYQELFLLSQAVYNWHCAHIYCSLCAGIMQSTHAGHQLKCRSCGKPGFPRTDPAVIMLVEFTGDDLKPKVLLGRNKHWPKGVFSALAGFVEGGETLEQAVAREVKEEAGISIRNICYVGSQAWPYPQSMMMGFFATADSDQLVIDYNELEMAKWFTREELLHAGNWGENEDLCLPRKDSIAFHLLDQWLKQ